MKAEWFVGIDWATKEHFVCLLDAAGKVVGERKFEHTGDGLAELSAWLFDKTGVIDPKSFHIAIEVNRGPVVETLLEREFNVYAINPKQLDRFRDRFSVAGAKDDRLDARVLAASLRTDGGRFRLLRVDDPIIVELRAHSRIDEELQDDRIRLTNRLREQLLRYYPQFLDIASDIGRDWFLSLWEIAPTPAVAKRVRLTTIAKHLLERRVKAIKPAIVVAKLREKPLTVAPGATEAAVAHIRTIIARLRILNQLIKETENRLDELLKQLEAESKTEQRDVTVLLSWPGIGRTVVATLLAEASQPLGARDYQGLRSLCGVAPVTKASGKRSGPRATVVMRQACSVRLRNAAYYWAQNAIRYDARSKALYSALRARGKTHGRALRTVTDRLLAALCASLRTSELYDPDRRQLAA